MRSRFSPRRNRACVAALVLVAALCAHASDHLDTPSVIADPAADIGDLYAWMAADGRHLNLVMTIVGKRFSDQLQYVFHVGSSDRFGSTRADIEILCEFDAEQAANCWLGDDDHAQGDASGGEGIVSDGGRFRIFAGLRNDPFFNNVGGSRDALNHAGEFLSHRSGRDAQGCSALPAQTSRDVLARWRATDGGAARDFLAGWTTAALVVSADIEPLERGGVLLAVWSAVHRRGAARADGGKPSPGAQIERMGRALTGNALIGLFAPEAAAAVRKEQYNSAAPAAWPDFVPDLRASLAAYDSFDGRCGNQWQVQVATPSGASPDPSDPAAAASAVPRYDALARLLADDRLWINSSTTRCRDYLAVEQAVLSGESRGPVDCGGRSPLQDAPDVFRSLLVGGRTTGVDDGVARDDRRASAVDFPFLAAP